MALTKTHLLLLTLLFISITLTKSKPVKFNVVRYGAKANGKTDSAKAFLLAWSRACASTRPAMVYVPRGRFYVSKLAFEGPCRNRALVVKIDGTLVASSNYWKIGNSAYWIIFRHVYGVTVSGGVLDGQGTKLWACKKAGKNCPRGATSLEFTNSRNIAIKGLTSLNSQMFHIVINECQNAKLQGIRILAPGNSPNTDGIHVEMSTGVTIMNSRIGTGDDCVSIGPGSSGIYVANAACGPGHGISIGSLGKGLREPGVQNVTVRSTTFTNTQNGVRIKAWGRSSNSFAKNILFQHVTMNNVQNPIIIDQNYCPNNQCPGQSSGVKISDVTYRDIHGTSATPIAVKFHCSKRSPCRSIRMENVKLTHRNRAAAASCKNADGTASGFVQPTSCL